ncbi:MAG: plastocyanin/azurin family copper-binding protein [Thermoleophilaceae bacterium]
MGAFRLVALAYALAVFLIAPAWLAAEEETEPQPAVPQVKVEVDPGDVVEDAVPDVPAAAPDEAVQVAEEPEPEPDPEQKQKTRAEPAKSDKKQEQKKDEPSAKASASASVTISDFKFTPNTVTVNEGDTVTWTNDGPTVHTATAEDGSFDTGILDKGQSGSATFTQAGTINYICSPHPYMKGKVIVQAASAGSGSGSSGSSDSGSDGASGVAGEDTTSAGGTSDDGSGLPSTGGETLSILLLGAATFGFGLLLRRRRET